MDDPPVVLPRAPFFAASFAVLCATAPAEAAEKIEFDIAAGPLSGALLTFANQAGVSVATGDPALRSIRAPGLHGRYSLREGLRRLLRGTGYDFRIVGGNVVQLVRRSAPRPAAKPSGAAARPGPAPAPPPTPIIVRATKQRNAELGTYPGSVHVASLSESESLRLGSRGSEVLLRELPNLSSTDLGSGRNKIFIRGIADSSFNGQTQATISQYLGESRLIYSAPDPDLALYDIERVEVVEGPQGTLYGAGSLGGVIRLTPRSPSMGVTEIAGTGAVSLTGSEIGGDAALVANLPITGNTALRAVGYQVRRPGYIDDIQRDVSDINRTEVSGLRATIRFQPSSHATFDFGVVGQNTTSKDGQYTDSGTSALTRSAALAQPFDNDYRLAFVTARIDLGRAELVSNTAYADHAIGTVFDATPAPDGEPTAFKENVDVSLLTHETRLAGSFGPVTNWVAGFSAAYNVNHVKRFFGPPDDPDPLSNVRSETLDTAFFGEATAKVWRKFSLTAGARISYVRQVDEVLAAFADDDFEPVQSHVRLLPTVALSWQPGGGINAYLRYQKGYRPGSQQITGSGADLSETRFKPDEIRTAEAGLRFGTQADARLSGKLSFAYSRWNEVQADLVTPAGFPYVANLGSGFVRYSSAELAWRPTGHLSLEASGFLSTSHLDRPQPEFAAADEKDLPNIADSGWRLATRYEGWIGETQLAIDASVGYVGKSYLAVGAPFEFSQGDYLDTVLGGRADFGRWGLSIDVENLLDSRANRFSYGNPFSLASGKQRTPLRPRTVRIGVDARF